MQPVVVLIDVDHTLLDGGRVRARISEAVAQAASPSAVRRFWALYDVVRSESGRVDVPEVAARLERELHLGAGVVIEGLEGAEFASCLHHGALDVLEHLGALGLTVVLSDGDPRFQRAKIESAGIAAAVGGRVMITTHKERELDEVLLRFEAERYVLLDDRVGILSEVKAQLGQRVTTVLVRQGRYAGELDAFVAQGLARPDLVVESIRDVRALTSAALLPEPR